MVETFYKSIVFSVVNNKHLSKDKKRGIFIFFMLVECKHL